MDDGYKQSAASSRMMLPLLFVLLYAAFQGAVAESSGQPPSMKKSAQFMAPNRLGSSVVFPLSGNVYPLGYYSVPLSIGNPPKVFDFDIDTGSDFTWVQCDVPCKGCTVPTERQYKPNHNAVLCENPLCKEASWPPGQDCKNPKHQCDYEIKYADNDQSMGALVIDVLPIKLTNGSVFRPKLVFGCGYDQLNLAQNRPPAIAGVIGLGKGKISVLSQLHAQGLTLQNIVGHCLSRKGGGFLFLGGEVVPPSGMTWTPLLPNPSDKHYKTGPAELLFGGKSTGVKGLNIIFDSGSSYTYFNSVAYTASINLIKSSLNGKPLTGTKDETLAVCWKGTKPFKSISDVQGYFKPLMLRFARGAQFQILPESYLIITKHGNVCLGIISSVKEGIGEINMIGDISMQDMTVAYDIDSQRLGWKYANCDRLPKS
ncbi:aspartic proteinase Asp1-like isoform X2 [Carica papaya]|uniref:aspartic proteinase Asp1-like isoform X2 n=1 Tax=Carica papaya TaxID=3649 RepID=UPI000B8CCAB0|nr:aspartic proteinase Asp1-like isoform X2 [Carica papaya]